MAYIYSDQEIKDALAVVESDYCGKEREIETVSSEELLEMYTAEIKRLHYDPCSDYARPKFDKYTMRDEIRRRMSDV